MQRKALFRHAWLLLCLGAASCASSGAEISGDELRVTLRNYRAGQNFELVSESHTDRVEYYSTPRDDAARKVVEDDMVAALIGELDKRGFRKQGEVGRAPSQGGSLLTWGLEIDRGGPVEHWIIGQGTEPDELLRFQEGVQVFLELYNNVISFQTIENPEGRNYFDSKTNSAGGLRR